MNTEQQNSDPKEKMLWDIARKRASFRTNLFTYLIVNGFLWVLWYFGNRDDSGGYPWPIWPMFGWGIGLVFHYFRAYVNPEENAVQREYEKLKNKNQNI